MSRSYFLDESARNALRVAREKRGYSMTQFADLVGCSRPMVKAIELGLKRPSSTTLDAICNSLDLVWVEQPVVVYARPARTKKVVNNTVI